MASAVHPSIALVGLAGRWIGGWPVDWLVGLASSLYLALNPSPVAPAGSWPNDNPRVPYASIVAVYMILDGCRWVARGCSMDE